MRSPIAVALTPVEVRRVLLHAQGLATGHTPAPAADDLLCSIRRMHALQIDTISVVARSQHLVLWARLGDFEPALLDQLLAEGRVFEHWSHAACFLDVADYPSYRRMMLDRQRKSGDRWYAWLAAHEPLVDRVLQHLREHGPARSADFERPDGRKGSGWWDWKEEKLALEMLLLRGDVMVKARQNFQRLYDLRERVLPDWDDSRVPGGEEAHDALALHAVRALGVGRADWARDYLRSLGIPIQTMRRRLETLAANGDLITVEVAGWQTPGYVHPDNLELVERAVDDALRLPGTALLSPFDPVVRDRDRALELFGFDYRIECYTPAAKRRYGYFALPILHGDALVGRLDPKAHRQSGVFEVKSVHLEPDVAVTGELVSGLRDTLHRLAAWHGTPEVIVRTADPPALAGALA
jgi:uncharacterized protein YcaQ